MRGSPSITHEIHVLEAGRWEIHATYSFEERDKCVNDAVKLFENSSVEAVRALREVYDASQNTSQEEVVYRSPKRPKKKKKMPMATARPQKKSTTIKVRKKPTVAVKSEIAQGAPRLAAVWGTSIGGAALVSYIVVVALQQLSNMRISVDSAITQPLIIGAFALSFFVFFIPLMRRFGPDLRKENKVTPTNLDDIPAAPIGFAPTPAAAGGEAPAYPAADAPSGAAEFDTGAQVDSEAEGGFGDGGEEAGVDEAGDEEEATIAADGTDVSGEMLMFIRDSLEPLAATDRALDAFNRFGLTLYFAGAGEYLASRHRISREEIQNILSTHAQMLGHTPEMALGFCANIDEYLLNPKYFKMYEAGRSAMVLRSQEADAELGVVDAMDVWNDPTTVTVKHDRDFVAVLFTDIVGSTAMTQERGDELAQLVVHAHDAIVRDALALHGGREIKHTGDGIMATFPQIVSAVEGAIAMQQACQRANAADSGLGLGLCIGVNAGEPIHEHGDIFGTPVQMAARVLSKAEGDEIAVSNIVREMCVGKEFSFSKKGDYDLKGFPEPVPIYLAEWQSLVSLPAGEAQPGARISNS